MVRRSPFSRMLVAIWGLWFTALLTGVHGLHSCPQHDAHAHGATSHGAASHGAHVHHATLAMAMAPAHASDAQRAAEPSVHETVPVPACNCLGSCYATDGALVPGSAAPTLIGVPVAGRRAAAQPDERVPASRRPHALPFANAPPTRPATLS